MSDTPRPIDFASLAEIKPIEELVDCPRWGGAILVREPSLEGILRCQDAYSEVDSESPDPARLADAMVRVIAQCAVNADGSLMFGTAETFEALRARARADQRTTRALFEAAKRVCLFDPTEAVKKELGESEGGPTAA